MSARLAARLNTAVVCLMLVLAAVWWRPGVAEVPLWSLALLAGVPLSLWLRAARERRPAHQAGA